MALFSIPEMTKLVAATAGPVTSNGGVTADYVSIKNAGRLYIVVSLDQAVGHAIVLTPKRATAVDGTGVVNLGTAVRIWANEATGTSDTLVSQTAATSYTVSNDIKAKQVVFEIDLHALGNTFDVVGLVVADSSQATNFVSALYILTDIRYQQATPPAAITD